MQTIFYKDRIEVKSYTFPICSLSQNFSIKASDIKEIRTDRCPPEIVLKSGEIIFFKCNKSEVNLALFARLNAITQVSRLDVWSLLCEPFLDTELDKEQQEKTICLLNKAGFSTDEVNEIRNKVRSRMILVNSWVWEWMHLSHYDVLAAFGEMNLFKSFFFSTPRRQFYNWCNEIANRAPEIKDTLNEPITKTKGKICDIVYDLTGSNSNRSLDDVNLNNLNALTNRLITEIVNAYTSPDRHYHNLQHVLKVVENVEAYNGKDDDKLILKLAAWFHDIIYNPDNHDNELKSAELFEALIKDTGMPYKNIERVKQLILLTKNHFNASTNIEKAFADADLAIFAEDTNTYSNYASGLRKEYAHLDDNSYFKGRLEFLENIEKRISSNGKLFFNLQPMHESQAKFNIAAEILNIRSKF